MDLSLALAISSEISSHGSILCTAIVFDAFVQRKNFRNIVDTL